MSDLIELIAARIIDGLREKDISRVSGDDLERHAYAVNDHIQNAVYRNMHILCTV